MAQAELKNRRRSDYGFTLEYRTRWMDNDMYDHVNNSVYYYFFDSIVNTYLATECGHSPRTSPSIGLVVHSHCDYFAPVEFPNVLDVCMRVKKLGKSSVTYELAIFQKGEQKVAAVGEFVHVFVEREGRRPLKEGMETSMKKGFERISAPIAKL